MKAMILAAGRGERLRPLTDSMPKPLIEAGGKKLIEYHLENIEKAGISDVVINISWLGSAIRDALGEGQKYNLNIKYSDEGEVALETAGGIINALPLLGEDPFIVINGDIWTDFDLGQLVNRPVESEAHLILVDNPGHNTGGDFALVNGRLRNSGSPMYTYSGIALFTCAFFSGQQQGKSALAPLLRQKIDANQVTGSCFKGKWTDVGNLERLNKLDADLRS